MGKLLTENGEKFVEEKLLEIEKKLQAVYHPDIGNPNVLPDLLARDVYRQVKAENEKRGE